MKNNNLNNQIFNQLPGYIGWKDCHFNYLGCNNNLANILNLKSSDKIVDLTDADLIDGSEKSFHFHRANDELVLAGNTLKYIHKSSSPYDGSFFYFIKKPFYDKNNNIIGIIFHCNTIMKENLNSALLDKKYNPSSHYQIIKKDVLKLSARELECLFYLVRGKTAKQSSEILRLSTRTVEAYIDNIRNKFGCHNKAELITFAIEKGYLNKIPESLISIF